VPTSRSWLLPHSSTAAVWAQWSLRANAAAELPAARALVGAAGAPATTPHCSLADVRSWISAAGAAQQRRQAARFSGLQPQQHLRVVAQVCTGQALPSCNSSRNGTCAGLPLSVGAAVQPLINRQAEAEAEWRARQFQQLNGGVEGVLRIGTSCHVDDLLQHQGAERLWYRSRLLLRELACCAPTSNSQAAVWRTSALATQIITLLQTERG
jgi:hypothetical protein